MKSEVPAVFGRVPHLFRYVFGAILKDLVAMVESGEPLGRCSKDEERDDCGLDHINGGRCYAK